MKRIGLAVTLLVLAGGVLADPLFCCALPSEDAGARFEAAPMDCCGEQESGCPPRLEKTASVPLATLDSVAFPTADAAEEGPTLLPPPALPVTVAHPPVRRPPRLHLVHSQFRI
jgi:hypothetical protein